MARKSNLIPWGARRMLNHSLMTAEMGTETVLSGSVVVIGWVLFRLEMEGKQIDSIQLENAVRFSLSA